MTPDTLLLILSVLGMSLVLAALPGLSRVLAVVGALYLAWLDRTVGAVLLVLAAKVSVLAMH
jgi:arginine exporter protein ArgO